MHQMIPDTSRLVGSQLAIGGHGRHTPHQSLDNEDSVEGIAMVEGQGRQASTVLGLDRQETNPVHIHLMAKGIDPSGDHLQLPQTHLDPDLPNTGGAEEQIVASIQIGFSTCLGKAGITVDAPQECVDRSWDLFQERCGRALRVSHTGSLTEHPWVSLSTWQPGRQPLPPLVPCPLMMPGHEEPNSPGDRC
jgi:hypothetical protein